MEMTQADIRAKIEELEKRRRDHEESLLLPFGMTEKTRAYHTYWRDETSKNLSSLRSLLDKQQVKG